MEVTALTNQNSVLNTEYSRKISTTNKYSYKAASDAVIIDSISKKSEDQNQAFSESLYVTAQKVLARLNDYLKDKLPAGIENLKPEEHTSEKTADFIVTQVTGLFEAYAKSNSDLEPQELVDSFMKAARKGIEQGYGEAFDILEEIGAFEIPGVQSEIKKTMDIIASKLKQFEGELYERYKLSTHDNKKTDTTPPILADQNGQLLDLVA